MFTFDERRGGYIATTPGLVTATALSLRSLRKRIEAQLPPTEAVKLELDRIARRERDRRRIALPSALSRPLRRGVLPSIRRSLSCRGPHARVGAFEELRSF
jgi:hypothetical protein